MKTEKDVQVEDSQTLETPQTEEKTAESQVTPAKRTFVQIVLPWVIVVLASLLVGAGVVFFMLYQPLTKELATAKSEASDLSTQLSGIQVDLEKANTDLNTIQLNLTEAQSNLETEKIATLLYKLQTDVNAAQIALLKLDPSSARQALSFAAADLAELTQTKIEADKLSGLKERIDTAVTNLESDPAKAIDSLNTLNTNLLLITNNLK